MNSPPGIPVLPFWGGGSLHFEVPNVPNLGGLLLLEMDEEVARLVRTSFIPSTTFRAENKALS